MTDILENYKGALPDGWKGGASVTKWWRGRIMHLYRLTRPCAECAAEMTIDVTKHALEGTAKNAGLHLKRCAICRARAKAIGTTSRPHVDGEPPARELIKHAFGDTAETIIATLTAEVKGLYTQNKELRQRLAKYEQFPWGG